MTVYSYFRAEGQSWRAVKTAEAARKQLEQMKRELCQRFGASDMDGGFNKNTECFEIRSLSFSSKVPEDWSEESCKTDSAGKILSISAKPAPETRDYLYFRHMEYRMEDVFRESVLELVFGGLPRQQLELPAGKYHNAFVRYAHVKDDAANLGIGSLRDHVSAFTESPVPGTVENPLDYMNLAGDWYIRVPNDASGRPFFEPPGAVLMDYFDMLKLDQREARDLEEEMDGLDGAEPPTQIPMF